MNKETITVSFPAKYGPNINGTFYNVDPKCGLKPEQFEKGKTYTVLVNTSKTGRKYIVQIVADEAVEKIKDVYFESEIAKPEVDVEKAKRITAPKSRDFDAEAKGKVACAAYCAALASPGLAMYATSKEEYFELVKKAAEMGIKFTWEHQKGE